MIDFSDSPIAFLSHDDIKLLSNAMATDDNNYKKCLISGEVLIKEGLTPFYIYDNVTSTLSVTSHELLIGEFN